MRKCCNTWLVRKTCDFEMRTWIRAVCWGKVNNKTLKKHMSETRSARAARVYSDCSCCFSSAVQHDCLTYPHNRSRMMMAFVRWSAGFGVAACKPQSFTLILKGEAETRSWTCWNAWLLDKISEHFSVNNEWVLAGQPQLLQITCSNNMFKYKSSKS